MVHGLTKHGMSKTNEYKNWNKMISRCCDPRNHRYPNYGGRGIKVCDRWLRFENFYADMGSRPSPDHSLDRHPNNDGNYEPGNVRWATRVEQNNNTRRNHMVEYRGEYTSLANAIRKSGSAIRYGTILRRISLGWDLEEALATQPQRRAA